MCCDHRMVYMFNPRSVRMPLCRHRRSHCTDSNANAHKEGHSACHSAESAANSEARITLRLWYAKRVRTVNYACHICVQLFACFHMHIAQSYSNMQVCTFAHFIIRTNLNVWLPKLSAHATAQWKLRWHTTIALPTQLVRISAPPIFRIVLEKNA